MKKLILLSVNIFLLGFSGITQSNQFGTLNLSAGTGLGVYATTSEFNATYGSFTFTDKDTSGAVTTYFNFSADFGIMKLLSAGVYFQAGKYLQEEESGITKNNNFLVFGIMPKIYLINKDKFNLNIGLGLGIQNLRTSEQNNNNNSKSEAKYSGGNVHLRLGMNYYFTQGIGLFFHTGYDANNLDLKELSFTSGNNTNTPSNLSGNLKANGLQMAIGLNFKFSAGGN